MDYMLYCVMSVAFVNICIITLCYTIFTTQSEGGSKVRFRRYLYENTISIGNRMNASAFRDLWARVMF